MAQRFGALMCLIGKSRNRSLHMFLQIDIPRMSVSMVLKCFVYGYCFRRLGKLFQICNKDTKKYGHQPCPNVHIVFFK